MDLKRFDSIDFNIKKIPVVKKNMQRTCNMEVHRITYIVSTIFKDNQSANEAFIATFYVEVACPAIQCVFLDEVYKINVDKLKKTCVFCGIRKSRKKLSAAYILVDYKR